jgi:alpha-tubulin suppressor-like RCC1 family protein
MRRVRITALCVLGVLALVAGRAASALAITSGPVAWGSNSSGQLGDGSTEASDVPVAVKGLEAPTAVAAGESHSLAVLSNSQVMAWGDNSEGQLGNPNFHEDHDLPVAVYLGGVTAVSSGGEFSLALGAGTVAAWGDNNVGQLGSHPEYGLDSEPQQVSGLSEVVAISAGERHSLALLSNGTVVAWGGNEAGQLGDGTTEESAVPVAVSGLSGVVAVAAGQEFSLALLADGTAMAWGDNRFGQLGDGNRSNSTVPVAVSELSGFKAISAGASHGLGLLDNGTVMAWGHNNEGQLGDGTTASSDVPVPVGELAGVTAISAGGDDSLALLSDSTVAAWGGNLGNGSSASSDLPVPVSGLSGITAISAGDGYSLAFAPPAPAVTDVSPNEGSESGGTSVTITGTTLTEATAVMFGSSPAASFSVNSASSITAVSPPGTGFVDVTVTTPRGTSPITSADQFRYGEPLPTVTDLTPHSGVPAGGTSVSITGTSLEGATAVMFGSSPAASFTVNSASSITAVSPAGTHVVDVTVTTPKGTGAISPGDSYSYELGPPEFGRCLKVAKGTGRYKAAVCTTTAAAGSYEWTTEIVRRRFTTQAKNVQLKTATGGAGTRSGSLVCRSESGSGEYSGTKEVINVQMTLTGCQRSDKAVCSSESEASGEITTNVAEGVLGITRTTVVDGKESRKVGLDLFPLGKVGALIGPIICVGTPIEAQGSVIGGVTADKMALSTRLVFVAASGHQKPEQFEAEPRNTLEGVLFGLKPLAMGLKMSVTQANEEAVEINAFA